MDAIFAFNIQLYCISHLRFIPHPFPPSPSSSRASKFSSPTSCFPPFFLSCPLLSSHRFSLSFPRILFRLPNFHLIIFYCSFLFILFSPSSLILCHLTPFSLLLLSFITSLIFSVWLPPPFLFVSILPLSSSVEFSPFSHFGFHSFFSPLSQIHFLDFSFT